LRRTKQSPSRVKLIIEEEKEPIKGKIKLKLLRKKQSLKSMAADAHDTIHNTLWQKSSG